MQRLDLTADELHTFHRALRSSHTRRIRVTLLTLAGDTLGDLSDRAVDGQVVVDGDADITRSLTLTLSDPHHSLQFDTDSPDDGALYMDRMLRVHYSVNLPGLGRRVSVPVFTGPITKLDRAGDLLDVEAQGKESLGMTAIWRPLTLKKGMAKTAAIRTILEDRCGEAHFNIPAQASRLPQTISLIRDDLGWEQATKIAKGMDRQLFYPGDGRATLRALPDKPVYTFRTGNGGDVVAGLNVSHSVEDVRNTIVVKGATPKGAKKPLEVTAVAEPSHPLSPQKLGRGGVNRHLVETIEDDTLRSKADANRRARRELDDMLRAAVEVTFDTMPIPHLDPGDLLRVETDETAVQFRLDKFTIPLGAGDSQTMPVGYHRKTTVNRRRIRSA